MYPESCDCGLPDHGPVDWSRGLTSLDGPRGGTNDKTLQLT